MLQSFLSVTRSLSPTQQFFADPYSDKIILDISDPLVQLPGFSQQVQKLRGEEDDHLRKQSVGDTAKKIS